jgi:hypothetical protein
MALPLWYLLVIVLFVLLQYTDSDYTFGIFWSLCCLFFFNIQILITPLVSFGSESVYWRRTNNTMTKRYQKCNQNLYIEEEQTTQWPKDTKGVIRICIQILITLLVSFGHCVVCSSSIYRFLLPLWYLLVIVLSVLQYTDSDYPFGIFWSLCCLFFLRTNNTMTKRYQRGNQNLYIEEGQTTQWPKDTKEVIRICILKKNKQHNDQKIPKG